MSNEDEGPFFSSSQLWYKPYITPALIVAGLICAAFSIKGNGIYVLRFLIVTWRFPFADILLFIVAMIVSAGAEGHMGLNFGDWGHMQILEEMSETAAAACAGTSKAGPQAINPTQIRFKGTNNRPMTCAHIQFRGLGLSL
ncbi:hypothetical protein IB237_14910 [Agrobacterium sp. AGB01]|uniref:hypothetical protein n=1 Tax=Agrobacterium sp. AGB01 TaxID=2769302 RepID=UPI00178074E5|nr:hypothetical protein [Agrobacterium sp. AGB01]MBD9388472.1 hypothetical protein [Agrobacterium sp. AGB01]